ncbi:MAG: hypothetical protein QME77_12060 [bacterium]|nr:hypothetical protein [bacterium]
MPTAYRLACNADPRALGIEHEDGTWNHAALLRHSTRCPACRLQAPTPLTATQQPLFPEDSGTGHGQARRDTRASALRTGRAAVGRTLKLTRQDRRRPDQRTAPTTPPTSRSGRTQDRARLILPEDLSDRTGLVPGTEARADVLEDGSLLLTPLPDQDAARLTWQADRLLRIKQAQDLHAWSVQMALDLRAPYAVIGRASRKKRRRIEARHGIPRDWPHQAEPPDPEDRHQGGT